MLGREHPPLEALGCVAGFDRDFHLTEHVTRIQLLRHHVHRTAAYRVAGLQSARVSVQTAIFRE